MSENPKVLLAIYLSGIALAVAAVVLLFQLDHVVNGVLYGYGLQFSLEWATLYWTFIRFTMGLVACMAGLNAFLIVYMVLSHQVTPPIKVRATAANPAVTTVSKDAVSAKEPGQDGVDVLVLPMVCNSCGRVFTQPLSMFDFKSGKARLVHACPYCNAVLAVSGNAKKR